MKPVSSRKELISFQFIGFVNRLMASARLFGMLMPSLEMVSPRNDITALAKSHFCDCCKVLLNSDEQVQQHVNGKGHKVKAGIIKKPPPTPPSTRGLGSTARGRGGLLNRGRGRGILRLYFVQLLRGTSRVGLSDLGIFGNFGNFGNIRRSVPLLPSCLVKC